jgi:hypothetical protein
MSKFIHGDNIQNKLSGGETDRKKLALLREINTKYLTWKKECLSVVGDEKKDTDQLVSALNRYKNFIEQERFKKNFNAQTKLHSTVLEEFIYYIFRLIPKIENSMRLGSMEAYTNLFFAPKNLEALNSDCGVNIYTKDQDFAIAKTATIIATPEGQKSEKRHTIQIPVVSVECKTYVDKTMYEGSVATAERIKQGNPYSRFIIVAEFYAVSLDVDPSHSKIDQIYVLRRQTNSSRKKTINPIDEGVVWRLYSDIKAHVCGEWSDMSQKVNSGLMIG